MLSSMVAWAVQCHVAQLYFGGVVTGALASYWILFGGVFLPNAVLAFYPLYVPFKRYI